MQALHKRVLLLMPTSTYHSRDFVDAAESLGVAVTVGVDGTQALQELVPGSTLTLDFNDPVASVAAITDFAREFPLDAVVAADDETTLLAAATAKALGLPCNPVEAVSKTRSKPELRRALAATGLPSPRYWLLENGSDEPPNDVVYPCVLKPTFLSASRGVIRADDPAEFRAAAQRIFAILADPEVREAGGTEAGRILVEEYIPGDEYAVEAMIAGGELHLLALFDKPDPLEGPFFEETIYVTPSRADGEVQQQVVEVVRQAVAALGLREGPLHAELRVNDSGAYLVDLSARAIGGLCARVLRFGTGMSLEEMILRHATGDDFSSFARENTAAGVMMIPIPAAGILCGVTGLDEASAVPGVDEVAITIGRGQRVVPLPEGNRYLGFIFARRQEPEDAEAALREAHAQLRFEIDPE